MANASAWTTGHPSGSSLLRDFDDLHRSDKSIIENAMLVEHYWKDGSANSAGEHKLGSARIFSGASSAVSSSGQSGRLMWDETNSQLVALHASTTTRIPSLASANTWSGTQTFSAAVTFAGATTFNHNITQGDGTTNRTFTWQGSGGKSLVFSTVDLSWDFAGQPWVWKEGGTERGRIASGVLAWGTTVTTGASAGDVVLASAKVLRRVNAAGTGTYAYVTADGSNNAFFAESPAHSGWYALTGFAAAVGAGESAVGILVNISGTLSNRRILVGAAGSGPGGSGHALYLA